MLGVLDWTSNSGIQVMTDVNDFVCEVLGKLVSASNRESCHSL